MSATELEVADIFRAYGAVYRQKVGTLAPQHERVIKAILQCRTAALGGHLYACDHCGSLTERYNSCRNRHCPKCQFLDKAAWLGNRQGEILPVTYFHVVFTIPDNLLNPLVMINDQQLYRLLFKTASETLLQTAADPKHLGAKIGFIAVLHTWGQMIQLHPHIHFIIPGGGLSPGGDRWISSNPNFFLPVKVLGKLFQGKFLDAIKQAAQRQELLFPESIHPQHAPSQYQDWLDQLYAINWNVYSKRPFGGSEKALEYLARYTHRVAISNNRLLRLEDDRVYFRYKDYKDDGKTKTTHLEATEFIRRYLLHVLPPRFHRIRYYGLFSNRFRATNLERCRELLDVSPKVPGEQESASDDAPTETWQERLLRLTGIDPALCPVCQIGRLVYLEKLLRKPPEDSSSRAPPDF